MPFPERLIEIAAGTFVVVLASAWLREKRPHLRGARLGLGAWWLVWLGLAVTSYVALLRAQSALTSSPSDSRMSDFARWFGHAANLRLAALGSLVVGLVAIVAAWSRTRPESQRD